MNNLKRAIIASGKQHETIVCDIWYQENDWEDVRKIISGRDVVTIKKSGVNDEI